MVIFKDVSRLGREHIDTNYYLGKYFPEKRIRVVSLLDNYDSMASTYDELLEIKTLLNDMYLRDTSRKIKTTIQTKRSMGEYTPKQPPFGYVKSKTSQITASAVSSFKRFTNSIKSPILTQSSLSSTLK